MLKELIEYIKEYEGDNELGDYLDTRYVRLTEQHYDQIASAMSEGELESKIHRIALQSASFFTSMRRFCLSTSRLKSLAQSMILRWSKMKASLMTRWSFYLPHFQLMMITHQYLKRESQVVKQRTRIISNS